MMDDLTLTVFFATMAPRSQRGFLRGSECERPFQSRKVDDGVIFFLPCVEGE